MSYVCGIDYSTRAVDVVLLDEDSDRAEWHRFELQGHDAFERSREVPRQMMGRWLHSAIGSFVVDDPWDGVLAIGIEEPRGHNAGALYRIQGAILACLPRHVLVQPWVPSAWRKQVGLPGNASKADVANWAANALMWAGEPSNGWPQDAFDAYAIATATRSVLQREEAA